MLITEEEWASIDDQTVTTIAELSSAELVKAGGGGGGGKSY